MTYAIGYQNIELSISPQVNGLVPKQTVQLYIWTGQTNTNGYITNSYNSPLTLKASVQQENTQNLSQVNGIDFTKIYYRFYLQSNIVSGLNRPAEHAQDYIVWNSQRFTIIMINDTFNTGWKYVIGVQDTSSTT